MKMIRHMSINLEGCLRNHKNKKIRIFEDEDGRLLTDKQARSFIQECMDKGWKKIPMGGECEGFDYFDKGCPGHPTE